MKISVLTPFYRVERFIERCARSLFEQTMTDGVEFIFVNDGSPDASEDVLLRVAAEYPALDIKIMHHERNRGLSAARQTLIDAAAGDYTIQIDSDDWVEPDMLEVLYTRAQETDADIVHCRMVSEYADGGHLGAALHIYATGREMLLHNAVGGTLANSLVRRSLYVEHGIGFVEGVDHWDDYAALYELYLFARRIEDIDRVLYHYNGLNENSMCRAHGLSERAQRQTVENIGYVVRFFEVNGAAEEFSTTLQTLKLRAKHGYMTNKVFRNIDTWRNTFPEVNRGILRAHLPLRYKLLAWSAARLPKWAALWVSDLYIRLRDRR